MDEPSAELKFKVIWDKLSTHHIGVLDFPPDACCSPADIAFIEESLQARLPRSYVSFCLEYGGGDFLYAYIYSCTPTAPSYMLRDHTAGEVRERPLLTIYEDGSGLEFGFKRQGSSYLEEIYMLDGDYNAVSSDPAYASLWDFLLDRAVKPC